MEKNTQLIQARKRKAVSALKMAELLGVSFATYRSWEKGTREPPLRCLRELCALFDAPPEQLGFMVYSREKSELEAKEVPLHGTKMHLTVAELVKRTREIIPLCDVAACQVPTLVTALVAEVGSLADHIMMAEGYRPPRNGTQINLEDDIVDVLSMLLRIAASYEIDLATHMEEHTRLKRGQKAD